MKSIKTLSFDAITKVLLGKKARFTSDCEFFPNFDVTGKIISVTRKGNENIMKCLCRNGKRIDIGSNMKNLKYELL